MDWTDEQKENILIHYSSIEEYEKITAKKEAQEYLKNTDYVVIKMAEYSAIGQNIDNDYTEVLQKREEARNIIRESEANANE